MPAFHQAPHSDFLDNQPVADEATECQNQAPSPYQCLLQEPTASLALDASIDPQCSSVAILGYN